MMFKRACKKLKATCMCMHQKAASLGFKNKFLQLRSSTLRMLKPVVKVKQLRWSDDKVRYVTTLEKVFVIKSVAYCCVMRRRTVVFFQSRTTITSSSFVVDDIL